MSLESRCAGVKKSSQGNDGDSQRQRQGHAVGGVDHHRETSTGPGNRSSSRARCAVRIDVRDVRSAMRRQQGEGRHPSTPTRRSSTPSNPVTCSGAVDQQPFLQGYLAIDSLWLYLNNGNVIGGGLAHPDRTRVHRQHQHRLGRRVRQERNSLIRAHGGLRVRPPCACPARKGNHVHSGRSRPCRP